ncbi:MAG: OmpA family protein [Cytophagales bacterium]|nr:OmpA family protein [Cytophagales bacterium]MDW8384327.1 OmpA family protein [Flammeovirgaceae bacterium]
MIKLLFCVVSYLAVVFCVFAQTQDIPFDKKFFPDKKRLKEALEALEEGNGNYNLEHYNAALPFFEKAYKLNPNNADLNFKIGKCYIEGANLDKEEAINYFKKAYELNPYVNEDIVYYLAEAYHFHYEFEKAIEFYEKYLRNSTKGAKIEAATVQKKIQECRNAIELSQKPVRVFIDNLGTNINTKYPEYVPVITTDESVMYFTSKRPDTYGGGIDESDGHYFEDVYVSRFVRGKWTKAENVGQPINSSRNDATVGLSPDGSILLVYEEGDIYECRLKGNKWSEPKKMPKEINTKYIETSASFSADNKTLYFVSDRPDLSIGGKDIFVTTMNPDGSWSQPKNIGTTINTPYDEESVFIHPDGKTMYFSSKGHNTIGGYDIFRSVYKDGKWSKPENLGMPINTPDDDVFLVVTGSGKRGYYSSGRKGGEGEQDIYLVTFLGPEKPMRTSTEDNLIAGIKSTIKDVLVEEKVEISSSQLTIFRGTTLDELTKQPVSAEIIITDNSNGAVINKLESNSSTGRFIVTLPAGKNYGIAVTAEGYLFHSENFDIPEGGNFQLVEKDVLMKKAEIGTKVILRNIFFDTDKATLRPESKYELDRLIKLLVENPRLKIEISGHTDNQGNAAYNQKLSERRAKAVVDYLVNENVEPHRLTYAGYGLTQPIADNKTPEGRQLNRRTEFKIISK